MKNQKYNLKTGKIILVWFIILFFFYALSLPKAHAQSLSLSISPPLFEVMIKPGKSVTQTFTLTNLGDTTTVTPKLAVYSQEGLINDPQYQKEPWINFVSTKDTFEKPFIMSNGQSRQFLLRINPPAGTVEKDYYRVLLFSTSPNPPGEYSISSVSQNIGAILLINVTSEGLIDKKGQISKVALPKIHDSFTSLKTQVYVKNTGNTYFRTIGKITLTGILGRASYNIEPNVILSGQERLLLTKDERSFTNKGFTFDIPGFYLGKYQLETNITLDEGNIKYNRVDEFYAVPYKLISVILIIAVLIKLIHRKKKKPKNKKQ
jgi:hypothetical protein